MGVDSIMKPGRASTRDGKRARVLLAAKVATTAGEIAVRLRDLSRKGALIEGANVPMKDEEVVFIRGETRIPARVAWSIGNRAGLAFRHMIDEAEILVQVSRGKTEKDRTQYRRPRLTGDDFTRQERLLVKLWGMSVDIDVAGG